MKFSLLRRLFHLCGIIMPVTYLLFGRDAALLVAAVILALLAAAEFMRFRVSFGSSFLRRHLKERELKSPTGAVFYAVSSLLVILLFDKPVAVASIFVLAFCDPVSAVVGSRWGGRRFRGKSPEGTIAFFLCAFAVLSCFSFGMAARVAAAAAATAAEFASPPFIDDNFSIPLACALVLAVLSR